MNTKKVSWLLAAFVFVSSGTALGSIIYSEDFEGIGAGGSLSSPWTWGVQGVNDNGATVAWNYFPGGTPGNIYTIDGDQGGPDQGSATLRSFADYGADYNSAQEIKTLLRYEHTITAAEAALGTARFEFDYKSIDIAAASRVYASLNLINGSDYSAISEDTLQITAADTLWSEGVLEVDISGQAGNVLQIGTQVYATQWSATATALDNINVQAIPEPATMGLIGLFGGGIMFVRRFFA